MKSITSYNAKNGILEAIKYFILAIILCFILAPFLFMFLSSLMPGSEMVQNGLTVNLYVRSMTLNDYVAMFKYNDGIYFLWYKNSVLITGIQTLLVLLFCSMAGYGLAVYDFKSRNVIFVLVLAAMMIPIEILILPLFKLSIFLNTMDTKAGVMLPFLVSSTSVFFFRQYVLSVSKDLIDSGRIDGCNELSIFFRIVCPVMLPAFASIMILQAMNSWNGFVWPLIILRSDEQRPFQ